MRPFSQRRLIFVIVMVVAFLMPVGVAGAAGFTPPIPSDATDAHCSSSPQGTICHYTRVRAGSNLPNWNDVVCDGFTISYTFTATGGYRDVYDQAGNLMKEVVQIGFTGTLMNASDPSKTVPYAGHWTHTIDMRAGTDTITGIHQHVVLPGQGLVSANIGRIVFTLDPTVLTPEFVAGQWDAFPGVPMDTEALCHALA
ncbi:MAG TPA: hypothetical protein VFV93_06550 [Thermomicrobiales bacterium]|nr:hypothetical protein [Thermomicrobiales bacterium]